VVRGTAFERKAGPKISTDSTASLLKMIKNVFYKKGALVAKCALKN